MSFTQDEIQSFNTILEQKLLLQRRELERSFEQRMNMFRRELEQRFVSMQEGILHTIPLRLSEQQDKLKQLLGQLLEEQLATQLAKQQIEITETMSQEMGQQQRLIEAAIERMLAAQLLAIEQLINQRLAVQPNEPSQPYLDEIGSDTIEVQTEVSWEDLVEVIDKALTGRLSSLEASIQSAFKHTEHYLLAQVYTLRNDLMQGRQSYTGNINNLQDVFASIEQLERIIESMQAAMTANHALLSNRLYHHQHLPLERAHPGTPPAGAHNVPGEGERNQTPHIEEQQVE